MANYNKNMAGNYIRTKDYKEKMSIACKRRFENGWTFSEKNRNSIRIANSNRIYTLEIRKRMSEAQRGKIPSDETRRKMSESHSKGKAHFAWMADRVSYRALHSWVERRLGKPKICSECGKPGNGHQIHWANISGDYKRKLTDWVRLCAKCHKAYDQNRLELSFQ